MRWNILAGTVLAASMVVLSCNDDDDGYNEMVGQPCDSASECYPSVDHGDLEGDVVCLSDFVEGGYCTHECTVDSNCCAVPGECNSDLEQVCSPLESASAKYCFVSCEGVDDPDGFCRNFVHPDVKCRSTGGGTENRKVCLP